jgi:hypothetical protein
MTLAFYKAYIAYTEITKGASLYNNNKCLIEGPNSLYWIAKGLAVEEKKGGVPFYVWILIGSAVILIFVAIVAYFMCCKGEEEETEDKSDTP